MGDRETAPPIVQSASNNSTGATSISVTLAAFGDAVNNACVMFTAITVNSENIVPGGSLIEIHDVGHGSPAVSFESCWQLGENLSPTTSWTTSTDNAAFAMEVKAAAAPAGGWDLLMSNYRNRLVRTG